MSKHYITDICPECGELYEKYSSRQKTCPACKPKVVGFKLHIKQRRILDTLPTQMRSQFVREAIDEKAKNQNI